MSDNIYYVILIKLIIYGSLLFRVTYVDLAAASHPKWRCCQVIKPAEHPCELGKEFVAALTCPAWALAIESRPGTPALGHCYGSQLRHPPQGRALLSQAAWLAHHRRSATRSRICRDTRGWGPFVRSCFAGCL